MDAYYMGGRRIGKVLMVMFGFGLGTHADTAVGVAAQSYNIGMAGIWYQWLHIFNLPIFWLLARAPEGGATPGTGLHVSFAASDRPSVDAFHAAALGAGAKDAGGPGLRPHYTMPFYGAFVLDLDGFKVEAVCRREE